MLLNLLVGPFRRLRGAQWRLPIGLQLSVLYVLLLATILILLGTLLYSQLDSFLVQNTARRLEQGATMAVDNASQAQQSRMPGRGNSPPRSNQSQNGATRPPLPQRSEPLYAELTKYLRGPEVMVSVLSASGAVITSTVPLDDGDPLAAIIGGAVAEAGNGGDSTVQRVFSDESGNRSLLYLQSVTSHDPAADAPKWVVQITSLRSADAILNWLRLYLALSIVVATVLGTLGGMAVTRVVLSPLRRIAVTAQAIAAGDLDKRLHLPRGRSEVARLAEAFDHMVARLTSTLDSQRRLVADASHELRTPLTSLSSMADMLMIGADQGDTGVVQQMVYSMRPELGRLSRLVADLLTLSRLDSAGSALRLRFGRIDGGQVLNNVVETMLPLAEARGVRLQLRLSGPLLLYADADQLKQVLLNLVDNALRFTPAGGEVRLSGKPRADGSGVELAVEDTGPGIAPADLPHIFERFYRGDSSRSRATGNSGLGLSIVHSIVEAHGGAITVQSPPGKGACFTLRLPTVNPIPSPAKTLAKAYS